MKYLTIAEADKIVAELMELGKTNKTFANLHYTIKHVDTDVLNSYKIEIHG